MPHSEADIGSSGLCWGKKEHTTSVHVPLMTGAEMSHSLGIFVSMGNPAHMSGLMAIETCHRSWLARSPDMALALIAEALSLKST